MTTLADVQARIDAISERAKERPELPHAAPPGVRLLPPVQPGASSRELARREQCNATGLSKIRGQQRRCPARGYDMLAGHALCWVHHQIVIAGVAPLGDVLAGTRPGKAEST